MFRIHSLIFMVGLAVSAFGFSSPAMAADKLTVLLEWFVNPDHAPLVIAGRRATSRRPISMSS